jgi:hypothetical protein
MNINRKYLCSNLLLPIYSIGFDDSTIINRKYTCSNLLPRIYSIGFDGSKTRLLSDRNCFYFDQILIPSETIVRVVENCLSKWPIAEPSTYRKVALRGADIKFRCPSEAQIDASKYPSNGRLGIHSIAWTLLGLSFRELRFSFLV